MSKFLLVIVVATLPVAVYYREWLTREPVLSCLPYTVVLFAVFGVSLLVSGLLKGKHYSRLQILNPGRGRAETRFLLDPQVPVSEKMQLQVQIMNSAGCFLITAAIGFFGYMALCLIMWIMTTPAPAPPSETAECLSDKGGPIPYNGVCDTPAT